MIENFDYTILWMLYNGISSINNVLKETIMFESIKFRAYPEFRKALIQHEKNLAGDKQNQQSKQMTVDKSEYQQWLKKRGFV